MLRFKCGKIKHTLLSCSVSVLTHFFFRSFSVRVAQVPAQWLCCAQSQYTFDVFFLRLNIQLTATSNSSPGNNGSPGAMCADASVQLIVSSWSRTSAAQTLSLTRLHKYILRWERENAGARRSGLHAQSICPESCCKTNWALDVKKSEPYRRAGTTCSL
jgi:hypothetical protein